jgi:beta-phosphoglucomutase-like phosphatase (HAD superfamily)
MQYLAVRLEAVPFDFDGLLVDTETAAFEAWREAFAEHGHVLSEAEWLPNVGANPEAFDPKARLEALVGTSLSWDAIDLRRRATRRRRCLPCPGARELVADAASLGLRTGLVNNSSKTWIEEHFELAGLNLSFDAVVCREDGHPPKPAPDAYLAALNRLGVAAGAAIAFEDSPAGVAAARAAGVKCIGVPNPITSELEHDDADLIVGSLADVVLAELHNRLDGPERARTVSAKAFLARVGGERASVQLNGRQAVTAFS